MGGWKSGGVDVYLGMTGSGKTTLAQVHRRRDADKWRLPCVTLDLESAADWAGEPHAESADQVLETLYIKKRTPRVWTPTNERERAKFFMAVSHWGGACILVDGFPQIADAHDMEDEFRKTLLRWRHGRIGPTFWYLTAQRASLVHRHVFTCCRWVYIFRQAPGVDADRVFHEFAIDPAISTRLKRGENVPFCLGFPEEGNPPADPSKTPGIPPPKDRA